MDTMKKARAAIINKAGTTKKTIKINKDFTDEEAAQRLIEARRGAASQGKTAFIKFITGKPIARKEAALAKCFECMGYFQDGRIDCQGYDCPLYLFYPYKGQRGKPNE